MLLLVVPKFMSHFANVLELKYRKIKDNGVLQDCKF